MKRRKEGSEGGRERGKDGGRQEEHPILECAKAQ